MQCKIQKAVEALNDQELEVKIKDRDLIALETKYHKNCLSTYIFKPSRSIKDESAERVHIFAEAFEKLITEIKDVFSQGGAFDMPYLLSQYKTYLANCGCQNADSYSAQRLKARIEKYFEGNVIFHSMPKKNEPELVYSSSVDLKKTINKLCDMKCQVRYEAIESDLTVPELDADKRSLFNEALRLRKTVRMVKGISLSPCIKSDDISDNKAEQLVPGDLYTFVCLLVFGKTTEDVRDEPHLHRRVMAIAQDIVYSASHSRCKTPKHICIKAIIAK